MKHILLIIISFLLLEGCEKYDIIDTGLANGVYDGTMWEYFHTNHYDWDSMILAIEYADIKHVFDGTDPEYGEITFFGITGWSVKQFIRNTRDGDGKRKYSRLTDVPADLLREMILSHVVKGKIMKEDVAYEKKNTQLSETVVTTFTGKELCIYRTRSDFGNMSEAGAEGMGINALESGYKAGVASADIRVSNGVVHSLQYEYQWTEL